MFNNAILIYHITKLLFLLPVEWVICVQIPFMPRPECAYFGTVPQVPKVDEMVFACSGDQVDGFVFVLLRVRQFCVDDADGVDGAVVCLDPLHHYEPANLGFEAVEHFFDADQAEDLETAIFEGCN